jgi:hypothetical protein
MTRKLTSALALSLLSLSTLVFGVHCSASESVATAFGPQKTTTDSGPSNDEAGDFADSGAVTAPTPGEARLDSATLLVNATNRFAAFRICPVSPEPDAVFSESTSQPLPTALMPRSNLPGVDINGAARIAVQPEYAGASEVLVFAVDKDTKLNPAIATASCRALACPGPGGDCVGSASLRRVPLVASGGNASGALAQGGKIVALRDEPDGTNLRFEVISVTNVPSRQASSLLVELRNLSDFKGEITYRKEKSSAPVVVSSGAIIPVGASFVDSAFSAGTYTSSLATIHQDSDPRVSIESFYASPGSFALLLVGQKAATDERSLRFLAVPLTAVVEDAGVPLPADGGVTTDGAPPSTDAGSADAKAD